MKRQSCKAACAAWFAVIAVIGQSAVAATSSAAVLHSKSSSQAQKVTITVNCEPPTSENIDRADWLQDVRQFEKQNPNITVISHDENPCDNPDTFYPKLAAGQEENVFYAYLTDTQEAIASGQVADIEKYLPKNDPRIDDILPSVMATVRGKNGNIYGLPSADYTEGLLYNRKLFQEAGLNPNDPPTTWAEVRADAKKITALGHGIVGYADYSADNQGGWHFTAELYSVGGTMVTPNGLHANFNNNYGREVLQNLYDMRWVDNSMGTKQLLTIPNVEQMMGANQLGMYMSAPDNIPQIVQSYGGSYANLAMGALPGENGPAAATLLGGAAYLFNVHDTPAQIEAGIKFLEFEFLTPGAGQFNYKRSEAQKQPVGLPEPNLWDGKEAQVNIAAKRPYSNEPIDNFDKFESGMLTMKSLVEPPDAQQIYSVLDGVMSGVLTDRTYNINDGLTAAASKVNTLLANYFG